MVDKDRTKEGYSVAVQKNKKGGARKKEREKGKTPAPKESQLLELKVQINPYQLPIPVVINNTAIALRFMAKYKSRNDAKLEKLKCDGLVELRQQRSQRPLHYLDVKQ